MTANAFAISLRLTEKGMNKDVIDSVAEEIVIYSDEHFATKANIVRLDGKIEALLVEITNRVKLLTNLMLGLYVGFALLLVDIFVS